MSDEQADNKPQVTAPTATAPRLKNPKRVEAGKLNAEKNKKAREAQKKRWQKLRPNSPTMRRKEKMHQSPMTARLSMQSRRRKSLSIGASARPNG